MKLLHTVSTAGAVSFALLAAPALAQDKVSPSFDKVSIGYADLEYKFASPTGFTLSAEKMVSPSFFISGDFLNYSFSYTRDYIDGERDLINLYEDYRLFIDRDASLFYANGNYIFAKLSGFAAYAGVGVAYQKRSYEDDVVSLEIDPHGRLPDPSSASTDTLGANVTLGLRQAIGSYVELDASIRHFEMDGNIDQLISVGARFFPSEQFSIDLGYTHIESDFTLFEIGASYHF
ncbi:outer membrane beta-barrel protein [Aliidiomarina sp. Khilg15.8]